VVNRVAALRFFFVRTLKRHQFREFLPYPRDRRRLPKVLSLEEVARLIDAAGTLFRRTLLMTFVGDPKAGVRDALYALSRGKYQKFRIAEAGTGGKPNTYERV
jgi:integrase